VTAATVSALAAWLARQPKPLNAPITAEARQLFYRAVVRVGSYRGHPDVLYETAALLGEQAPAPLYHAGLALVLTASSYISGGNYDPLGLTHARAAIDIAQVYAPDAIEVRYALAAVLLRYKQLDEAAPHIEFLLAQEPDNSHFLTLNMLLLAERKQFAAAVEWFDRIDKMPLVEAQRINLANSLAFYCMAANRDGEAIRLYRQVLAMTPQDPWAWHNLSIIHLRRKNYWQCYRCNRRALGIMQFGAAHYVRGRLDVALRRQVRTAIGWLAALGMAAAAFYNNR